MGSSLRQKRACWRVPAILMREEPVRSAPPSAQEQEQLEQVQLRVQLEQVQLRVQLEQVQLQLEYAGSTPSSCASAYPEAPRVLFDHMRRRARRGTQGSTDALFSWREYTACRAAEV
jgi:hypothetical protein